MLYLGLRVRPAPLARQVLPAERVLRAAQAQPVQLAPLGTTVPRATPVRLATLSLSCRFKSKKLDCAWPPTAHYNAAVPSSELSRAICSKVRVPATICCLNSRSRVLAAAGVLTIIPGALVIWFVRNYIAKGFALGRV